MRFCVRPARCFIFKEVVFINISISYYTEKGARANNEDAVSLIKVNDGLLAIVADGLGGHDDGEIASGQAIAVINRHLQTVQPNEDAIADAIRQAGAKITAMQSSGRSMHTTAAVLWLDDYSGIAAHVGDSRIYQFRNGKIIYQSVDHSVAQMAVLVGELEPAQLRTSRDRNRLIRVLGGSDSPAVDSRELSVQENDRFLLCSDGFWEAVLESEMLETIRPDDSAEEWLASMRAIVDAAGNPAQDNHTAIALIVGTQSDL